MPLCDMAKGDPAFTPYTTVKSPKVVSHRVKALCGETQVTQHPGHGSAGLHARRCGVRKTNGYKGAEGGSA